MKNTFVSRPTHKKNNNGFTLAELLIVVAIIAVLVAISIPIFTKQLEKSRESVDIANMRNAYALISVSVLTEDNIDGIKITDFSETVPAYYDISGKLTKTKPAAYGKGTATNGGTSYSACNDYSYNAGTDYRSSVITVWYDGAKVHVHWDNAVSGNGGNTGTGGGSTGGGGSSGGGNIGGSTGGDGSEPDDNKSETPIEKVESSAKEWKREDAHDVKIGEVYIYDGKYYISLCNAKLNAGGTPEKGDWYEHNFACVTKTFLSMSDTNGTSVQKKINYGDIFQLKNESGDLYIWKGPEANWNPPIPPDDSNWVKIITE